MSLPLNLLLISIAIAVALCFHVVKTRQDTFWLWIILMFQPLGGLVYFCIILLPSLFRSTGARKLKEGAREALDPGRDYREAKQAMDDTPTVHNRMRFGAAAMAMGRFDEAEAAYREAAQGVHADDPALQLGRAKALIELGRGQEALTLLEAIQREQEGTAASTLALARTYQLLQRPEDAERAYREAVERMPGLEAIARYAAFLRTVGRQREAADLVLEIDRRSERVTGPFKKEARAWREVATRG